MMATVSQEQKLSTDLEKVLISEDNKENTNKITEDNKENAVKQNKITAEISEETPAPLSGQSSNVNVCAYCKKANPSKRCSKRHPKCLKKMFCNESCEISGHKKKEEPTASEGIKKPEIKKKKKKSQGKHSGGDPVRHFAYKDYE